MALVAWIVLFHDLAIDLSVDVLVTLALVQLGLIHELARGFAWLGAVHGEGRLLGRDHIGPATGRMHAAPR